MYSNAVGVPLWLQPVDHAVLVILIPLAVLLLLSGLDDLTVDAVWAYSWLKRRFHGQASLYPPGERLLDSAPTNRIAILVPLWHEDAVIARMLEHNLAAIRYGNYHFFCGCYPNDAATQAAVTHVARRYPTVHLALCPHDGPTSKADCLNWIFQNLLLHEEGTGERFDLVVTHDAEDMIHPDELRWINYYADRFDFIQTPVLALPTPLHAITHGVYCDEFAESHFRDMTVRASMGGFIPGAGVGTGYRREALEQLARASANRVFEPAALTEDYESGLRLFRLGCSQAFVPIMRAAKGRDFVATREFFPSTWRAALRQRTRWATGIALQGMEHFGWSGKPGEVYWLWRDRKGLLGNPLSFLANGVFVYGIATALWTRTGPLANYLSLTNLALQCLRTAIRMACSARIYGWTFALFVPVRFVYANALNSCAAVCAICRYASAKLRRQPLRWLKTAHAFPNRAALLDQRRKIGEILVASGDLAGTLLRDALASCPADLRIGEHLLKTGGVTEDALYNALSLQQGLPLAQLSFENVPPEIARALPATVAREWRVLPFRVEDGSLHLAGPEAPTATMTTALRAFTSLELRFHLLTPSAYRHLTAALL